MSPKLFVSGLALVLLALALELKGLVFLGFAPDLVLVACILLTAFFTWPALLFMTVLAMWFLNWQPTIGESLLLFALLVLVAALGRRFLPWQPWFANLLLTGLAVLAFHGILHWAAVRAEPVVFLQLLVTDLLFGTLAFLAFEAAFGPVRRSRM